MMKLTDEEAKEEMKRIEKQSDRFSVLMFFLLLAIIAIGVFYSKSAKAQGLPPLVAGEVVQGKMWACLKQEDAVEIAIKEIADGMDEGIKLFTSKEGCLNAFAVYSAVKVVATVKNATTTTYVVEVDVGGEKIYALSKVPVVAKKGVSI